MTTQTATIEEVTCAQCGEEIDLNAAERNAFREEEQLCFPCLWAIAH